MLGIPKLGSFEEFLGSSWLSIRVSTVLVIIMAFQSKKVIEAFSLYDGWTRDLHSFSITFLIALAILTFTVKIHNVPKPLYNTFNWLKFQLTLLVLFFAAVEFMLQVAYHVLWHNRKTGTIDFTFPEITPEMTLMLLIDAMLPLALFFYAHTVHIKTRKEAELLKPLEVPTPAVIDHWEDIPKSIIQMGDKITLKAQNGKETEVEIIETKEEQYEIPSNKST
jgi:cation transport ATPase